MRRINLNKSVFSREEANFIVSKLKLAVKKGFLVSAPENNEYLICAYKGVEEKGITPKWNIKLYKFNHKKQGHSLVCVDKYVLENLIRENYTSFTPPDLQVLRIDDAGWGFPLCGVMVGVCDEEEVLTATVPVEYFRSDTPNHFATKKYLTKYAELALELINTFGGSSKTHRIEICTGYVNQPLREKLRNLNFDVRVVEIKGMLQDELEIIYRDYISIDVGADIYYDPKEMNKSAIPKRYYECLDYGRKYCPEKIKTGWKSISG